MSEIEHPQETLSRFTKVEIPFKESYTSITKMLMVSNNVVEHLQFSSVVNDTTLSVVFDTNSDFDDFLLQLSTKITSLERIAIVTHGLPTETFEDHCVLKYFFERETFFYIRGFTSTCCLLQRSSNVQITCGNIWCHAY